MNIGFKNISKLGTLSISTLFHHLVQGAMAYLGGLTKTFKHREQKYLKIGIKNISKLGTINISNLFHHLLQGAVAYLAFEKTLVLTFCKIMYDFFQTNVDISVTLHCLPSNVASYPPLLLRKLCWLEWFLFIIRFSLRVYKHT